MGFFIGRKLDCSVSLRPDMFHPYTTGTRKLEMCPRRVFQPSLVQFFLNRISEGFKIAHNYESACLKSATKNLDNALQYKEVVSEYLQTDIDNKRVAGPFSREDTTGVYTNKSLWCHTNESPA